MLTSAGRLDEEHKDQVLAPVGLQEDLVLGPKETLGILSGAGTFLHSGTIGRLEPFYCLFFFSVPSQWNHRTAGTSRRTRCFRRRQKPLHPSAVDEVNCLQLWLRCSSDFLQLLLISHSSPETQRQVFALLDSLLSPVTGLVTFVSFSGNWTRYFRFFLRVDYPVSVWTEEDCGLRQSFVDRTLPSTSTSSNQQLFFFFCFQTGLVFPQQHQKLLVEPSVSEQQTLRRRRTLVEVVQSSRPEAEEASLDFTQK
ncbi:uncharacterized protein V6R79_008106 [Siganus canaliculatus]